MRQTNIYFKTNQVKEVLPVEKILPDDSSGNTHELMVHPVLPMIDHWRTPDSHPQGMIYQQVTQDDSVS
jgi:hypothetical protein